MIDVDNYFKDFKPKFNNDRYEELMKNTPLSLETEKGSIYVGGRLMRSILTSCRLLWNEFDRNNIYYGPEGGGKSHTVFQHTYVWWWCLNELGMINYKFGMHLVYGRLQHVIDAFDKYKDIPFMIFTLDESDELNRKNWQKPAVKEFMSKLRRERKNLRVVNLLMPALEEMLPAITLSRIAWIIEIEIYLDVNFNVQRGHYAIMNIPVSNSFRSPMFGNIITRKKIKAYLGSRLYSNEDRFSNLPRDLLAFTDRTNKVFMFDKVAYRDWARELNAQDEDEENQPNDQQKRWIEQRDRFIIHLKEKLGLSQEKIAAIGGLSRTGVGEICRGVTVRQTTT